eukprot:4972831-Alexandrium_andersonii.AAC.1
MSASLVGSEMCIRDRARARRSLAGEDAGLRLEGASVASAPEDLAVAPRALARRIEERKVGTE